MVVRGAPAIGVTAAYGVALSALQYEPDKEKGIQKLKADMDVIANCRPTAINLKWAVARMARCLGGSNINAALFVAEAEKIHKEAIADDLYYVSSPHHFIFLEGYYDEYEKVEYKEV